MILTIKASSNQDVDLPKIEELPNNIDPKHQTWKEQ